MAHANVIHGTVSVVIDDDAMKARLVFVPGKNHEEIWNAMSLDSLIRKPRLPAVPVKVLEHFLAQIAGSRQPCEAVICQGQEPSAAVPEQPVWIKTPLSGETACVAEAILSQAGPPEIYRTRTRRVKKQRKVKKPGRPAAVETWFEDIAVQEKVAVDPDVLETYAAERGKAAGSLIPAQGGKPGKNIYGQLVKPVEAEKPGELLFGIGLELHQNTIIPVVTGILRIGQGWADVVPVPEAWWSMEIGEDGTGLYLDYTPGHPLIAHPKASEILAHAVAPPFSGAALIGENELDRLLDNATATGQALEHFPLYRYRMPAHGDGGRPS
jgi:hypothetical protein